MKLDNFICGTMGKIDPTKKFGLVLWANRPLGKGFLLNIILSQIYTGCKPYILVDDLLPQALFDRSNRYQRKVNISYTEFFSAESCRLRFSSQLFSSSSYLYRIFKILNKLTYHEFIRCLPKNKKTISRFNSLKISEILHAAAELILLEEIKKFNVGTLIIPNFSQAIIALHRNISPNPLNAIITPRFGSLQEIENQIVSLKKLLKDI